MSAFAHLEDGCGWRPRHPIVCILNVLGLVMVAGLLNVYRPSPVTAVLPLAVALQYVVSLMYHWLPYSFWRFMLDRSVIFLLIGAHFVPYWGVLLPPEEGALRLALVGASTVLGIGLMLAGLSGRLVGILWTVYSAAGPIVSFHELQVWLPPFALAAFWLAALAYALQQVVFGLQWPDPVPGRFGYREVQHVLLLGATMTMSVLALTYVG